MMTPDEIAGGEKRRYEPPHLTRVRLVPDEAVLASCKNNATTGPVGAGGRCTASPALCSHNAS